MLKKKKKAHKCNDKIYQKHFLEFFSAFLQMELSLLLLSVGRGQWSSFTTNGQWFNFLLEFLRPFLSFLFKVFKRELCFSLSQRAFYLPDENQSWCQQRRRCRSTFFRRNKADASVLHIMKRLDSSEMGGLVHSFTQANTVQLSADVERDTKTNTCAHSF